MEEVVKRWEIRYLEIRISLRIQPRRLSRRRCAALYPDGPTSEGGYRSSIENRANKSWVFNALKIQLIHENLNQPHGSTAKPRLLDLISYTKYLLGQSAYQTVSPADGDSLIRILSSHDLPGCWVHQAPFRPHPSDFP